MGWDVHVDDAVRAEALGCDGGELAYDAPVQTEPEGLIGHRRLGVPVGYDGLPARQGGSDDLGDKLRSRGGQQQRHDEWSCLWGVWVEQESPHSLAHGSSSGLAGLSDRVAGGAQRLTEQVCLRRLTASVGSLKRDEEAHRYTKSSYSRG